MSGELTAAEAELQARARAFAEEVLIPLEVETELRGGRPAEATIARIASEGLERGLSGGLHAREHGGHSVERQELDFNGTAQAKTLPASEELGAVQLDYRKH